MSNITRDKKNNTKVNDIQGGEKKVMTTKFNKKIINVLATATLIAGVAAPITALSVPTVVEAAGTGTIKALTTPTISAKDANERVGNVVFEIPKFASLEAGDTLEIELPFDLAEKESVTSTTYSIAGADFVAFDLEKFPDAKNKLELSNEGDVEVIDNGDFKITEQSKTDRIIVEYIGKPVTLTKDPAVFTLTLGALYVEEGENGEAKVRFSAPSSSPFPAGEAIVAKVNDENNSMNLSFGSLDTSNEVFTPNLILEEPFAGALNESTEIKIKLPKGYEWDDLRENKKIETIIGNFKAEWLDVKPDPDKKEELIIKVKKDADDRKKLGQTKTPTKIEIPFNFIVEDSSKVKEGEIIARVSGDTTTNITEGKIGTYGEYGSTLTAEDAPTLIAGRDEQEIAEFHLTETIGESIVTGANGRYLEITLPEGARWQPEYEHDEKKDDPADLTGTIKDEGVTLKFAGYTGTNNRTAKFKAERTNDTDAATLDFEDLEVALAPDFTGDLKLAFGGSAGIEGELVVGKVVAPVTASVETTPEVVIGAREQKAGDFTIKEGAAGALVDDKEVRLELPDGVKFAKTPTVKVSGGDLDISNVKRSSNDKVVSFNVDAESDTASTISVSDVSIIVDRTVPEGPIELSVRGDAVSETQKYSDWEDNDAVAKVSVAKVSTPAPTDQTTESVFTIGSTSYTVNGATYTADIAPYIENGRTFLPVRYVAEAVGVSKQNIKFDKATSTVTLLKGDRVVQIKLNTNQLIINGAVIHMDVKASTKSDRTVLPVSWVAQALGANISYDEATKTVKVNN
ncbi:copper amine oxidase N-terminal domain-containing protein [Paenibacillus sanguinis]|uniref:copper amine oxidase N-terminal domain-containing protein n=1 Tax=Paenibacillus sanguinis TaxID=225906 RepID=UPI0003749047|nr:copper amine oxidase N-terminal domain-containing protein [Paenibacillus sanguinis]